jgi:hypothetical protein
MSNKYKRGGGGSSSFNFFEFRFFLSQTVARRYLVAAASNVYVWHLKKEKNSQQQHFLKTSFFVCRKNLCLC